jgi:non-canonical (house-cleaning) NTP pyrophosphatase
LLDITNATDIRIDLYFLVNVESGIHEMKTIKTYLINITICIMAIISKT